MTNKTITIDGVEYQPVIKEKAAKKIDREEYEEIHGKELRCFSTRSIAKLTKIKHAEIVTKVEWMIKESDSPYEYYDYQAPGIDGLEYMITRTMFFMIIENMWDTPAYRVAMNYINFINPFEKAA